MRLLKSLFLQLGPFLIRVRLFFNKGIWFISNIYIYAFSRHFYPKRLTYSGYNFFLSVCVFPGNWTTTFVLLTQCSTTEPQEHYMCNITAHQPAPALAEPDLDLGCFSCQRKKKRISPYNYPFSSSLSSLTDWRYSAAGCWGCTFIEVTHLSAVN